MKNIKTLIAFFFIISCVKNNDYNTPEIAPQEEPNITVNSNIEALKKAWNQNYFSTDKEIYTFENSDLYIQGYVVSSDYAGNFYKSLIIQNTPENPTHGIEILINKTALFETFEIGRKVYIKLDGLSISYEDGETNNPTSTTPGRYRLGIETGGIVDDISSFMYANHILRSTEVTEIIPKSILGANFTQDNLNTYIEISDMQFSKNDVNRTFSGETSDEFDGLRNLNSCTNESTISLQTSTYSDFKSTLIPSGVGTINAVLAKDFRADNFVLKINSPADILFTSSERCDPIFLDCNATSEDNLEIIFSENFNETTKTKLETDGWLNVNINNGAEVFDLKKSKGNKFMEASAYGSEEKPMEVWLISPSIDLDNSDNEIFTFKTKAGYYKGAALSVYISTDFDDDISTATWTLVDAYLVDGPPSGYGGYFISSGEINISCLTGNIHLGFRYLGADGTITTTFRIDDVKIIGKK